MIQYDLNPRYYCPSRRAILTLSPVRPGRTVPFHYCAAPVRQRPQPRRRPAPRTSPTPTVLCKRCSIPRGGRAPVPTCSMVKRVLGGRITTTGRAQPSDGRFRVRLRDVCVARAAWRRPLRLQHAALAIPHACAAGDGHRVAQTVRGRGAKAAPRAARTLFQFTGLRLAARSTTALTRQCTHARRRARTGLRLRALQRRRTAPRRRGRGGEKAA